MGVISFAAFRPKEGRDGDLLEVIGDRLPLLRRLGLATEREHIVVRTPSGIIMEVSEWVSGEAIDAAHKTAEVLALWKRFDECSQYVTPNDADEFEGMFPTFPAVVAEPGVRLVAWGSAGGGKKDGVKKGGEKKSAGATAKKKAGTKTVAKASGGAGVSGTVRELADALRAASSGTDAWGASGSGRSGVVTGTASKVLAIATGVGQAMGLDVYRVDMAGVASKYIGETEKNLSRVLRAAENADAVLLFDEADALFGKRSGVRDAHDRYANIEVSYLLSKLEEHRGVALMGVRKRGSLDEAFLRRMRVVV